MLLLLPWTMMLVTAVTFGWYLWPARDGAERSQRAPLPWPRLDPRLVLGAIGLTVLTLGISSDRVLGPRARTSTPALAPPITLFATIPTAPQPTWALCAEPTCMP